MNGLPWKPYTYRGNGEDVLTAWMDDEPDEPVTIPIGRPATQPCGTLAAYRRHYRRGEEPCEACRQAELRRLEDRRERLRRAA